MSRSTTAPAPPHNVSHPLFPDQGEGEGEGHLTVPLLWGVPFSWAKVNLVCHSDGFHWYSSHVRRDDGVRLSRKETHEALLSSCVHYFPHRHAVRRRGGHSARVLRRGFVYR